MSEEQKKSLFFQPVEFFKGPLMDLINFQQENPIDIFNKLLNIKSIGSIVLKESEGRSDFRVSFVNYNSGLDLLNFSKNQHSFKIRYAMFNNLVDHDSLKFSYKFSPFLSKSTGKRNMNLKKLKLSHYMPLSNKIDYIKTCYEKGWYESENKSKFGVKFGYPLLGRRFSIFQEEISEQGSSIQKAISIKGMVSLDFTNNFQQWFKNMQKSQLKIVHPLFGFDKNYSWQFKIQNTLRLPVEFINTGSFLEIAHQTYGSNRHFYALYNMRGLSHWTEPYPNKDELNLQTFLNFKWRNPKSFGNYDSIHWFFFLSFYAYNLKSEKITYGLGVNVKLTQSVMLEFMLDYHKMNFVYQFTTE